jgi:hypothetical protein
MPFVVAFTVLLCVLVASLLVTNSHLLARVVQLERQVSRINLSRANGSFPEGVGFPAIELAPDLESIDGDLVIVSASCASCAAVLDRVCRELEGQPTIVVASEADAAMIDGGCAARVLVSAATVQAMRSAGHHLPVWIRIREGLVTEIVPGQIRQGT